MIIKASTSNNITNTVLEMQYEKKVHKNNKIFSDIKSSYLPAALFFIIAIVILLII